MLESKSLLTRKSTFSWSTRTHVSQLLRMSCTTIWIAPRWCSVPRSDPALCLRPVKKDSVSIKGSSFTISRSRFLTKTSREQKVAHLIRWTPTSWLTRQLWPFMTKSSSKLPSKWRFQTKAKTLISRSCTFVSHMMTAKLEWLLVSALSKMALKSRRSWSTREMRWTSSRLLS